MKITENEVSIVILVLCGFFGMLYPDTARWILLVLVVLGVWSFVRQT